MADPRVSDASAAFRPAHAGARCGTSGAFAWGAVAFIAGAAVSLSIIFPPIPLLLWNASASSPIGLYAIGAPTGLKAGDMAVAWAPLPARRIAERRSYLPYRVPLVKRVAAVAGDRVCAKGNRIFINRRPVALRRERDPSGRPMPRWSGCARLEPGELFLLSHTGPLAFDGRYFGVTRAPELVGRARLLWAKPVKGRSLE